LGTDCKRCGKTFALFRSGAKYCTSCRSKVKSDNAKKINLGSETLFQKKLKSYTKRYAHLSVPFDLGFYFSGLVDGEGSFVINKHFQTSFHITLRSDDHEILWLFKRTLRVGEISYIDNGRMCSYQVSDLFDLYHIVVPFFEQFPLRAKKLNDYKIWSKAVRHRYKYEYKSNKLYMKRLYLDLKKIREYI
jgi:hypothetical protein